MHCREEYATALALAILCRQISRGLVRLRGALPTGLLPAVLGVFPLPSRFASRAWL